MSKIDVLFQEWNSLQPLKEENQIRLDQKFMLEFNYNSNHLEGNTLTYGQTEFLLMFGKVVDNADMKDLEEMKASNVGLQKVLVEAEEKERPLTEAFIRDLHRTLFREDYEETREYDEGRIRTYTVHVGKYKTRPNTVKTKAGVFFQYASPEETPALMADLVNWYNKEERKKQLTPIELASLFHYRYIRIHPFEDGNGRMSRLLVNFILHRHGYPMIVIKSADKENYLFALNQCDLAVGDVPAIGANADIDQIQPFVAYLSVCLEHALTISIKAAKGEKIEEENDFEKKMAIIERNARRPVPKNEHIVTPQDRIDVFNNFHRHFAIRLKDVMKPVFQFYNSIFDSYYMSISKDNIIGAGFFSLDPFKELTLERSKQDMEVLNEARAILRTISLYDVKPMYSMRDESIRINASVYFENTYYVFNDKSYPYGSYPTEKDIDIALSSIKESLLMQINQAME